MPAATRAHSAAERTYSRSEVRGRNQEDPMPMGSGQEELPHVRGQGQWPRVPGCDGAGTAKRSYPASVVRGGSQEELLSIRCQRRRPRGATPCPRSRAARKGHPAPEVRGGGREEPPHVQGAVAAWAQEGLKELSHIEGQEG